MLFNKNVIFKVLSKALPIAILASSFALIPSANAAPTVTVTSEAGLRNALLNPPYKDIILANSIALAAPLVINRNVTIDGLFRTTILSGDHIFIGDGTLTPNVTLQNLTLSGTENLQPEGNYGVWVDNGSSLTATNIALTVDGDAADVNNVGFNVDPGASLTVSGSTITVYKKVTAGSYAVYAQSGAVSVDLTANTIDMIEEVSAGYTHLIGTEGDYIASTTLTLGTNIENAEVELLLADMSTVDDAKGYAFGILEQTEKLRVLSVATDISGIFTRTASGWSDPPVTTEAQLLLALDGASEVIILGASIELTAPLVINRDVTIDGVSTATVLSGNHIFIGDGTLTPIVTLQNLTLSGTENLQPEGNYGVWVDNGSSLTATNIALTVDGATAGVNNVGFNVDPGADLTVVGSTITVYKKVTSGSYAVYAQSGAASVVLTANTINMIEEESTGYTHLIGTEGDYIASTTLTLGTNIENAEVELLLADMSTVDDAKGYAFGILEQTEKLRVLSVATDISGIFTRTATDWSVTVTTEAQLLSALAGSSEVIILGASIELTAPLVINRDVTIDGVSTATVLSGNHIFIGDGTLTPIVTLQNLTLSGTENLQPEGNYGVWVDNGSSLTATNIALTVDGATAGVNNVGFNVDPGADLTVVGSTITVYKKVTSGSYAVYAQSGAASVVLTANTINMIEEESTGYTHLIGTEGDRIGTITLSGNTSDAEVALLDATNTEESAKDYAIVQNAVAVDEQLRILSVATDISGIFTRTGVDPFWENYTLPPVIIGGGGGGGGGVDPAAEAAAKAAAEAAAKAAAEAAAKAAAEAAAKAAAEAAAKAAAEAAAKAAAEAAAKNTIKYRITSKTKSIFIDLADTYANQVADVSVKLLVLRNGKKVYRYVAIDSVVLDSQGKATSKTKAQLKIGTVIRIMIDGSVVKSVKIT